MNRPVFGDPKWIAAAKAPGYIRGKGGRRTGQPWADVRGHLDTYDHKRGELGRPWKCKDCVHCKIIRRNRTYRKCGLAPITHGPGTDIRMMDPACVLFTKGDA